MIGRLAKRSLRKKQDHAETQTQCGIESFHNNCSKEKVPQDNECLMKVLNTIY